MRVLEHGDRLLTRYIREAIEVFVQRKAAFQICEKTVHRHARSLERMAPRSSVPDRPRSARSAERSAAVLISWDYRNRRKVNCQRCKRRTRRASNKGRKSLTGIFGDTIVSRMKTATVRDLRNQFGKLSKWLESGDTIEIIKRGKPFARVVPVTKPKSLLGCMAGTAKLPLDIEAPLDAEWEAMR